MAEAQLILYTEKIYPVALHLADSILSTLGKEDEKVTDNVQEGYVKRA